MYLVSERLNGVLPGKLGRGNVEADFGEGNGGIVVL